MHRPGPVRHQKPLKLVGVEGFELSTSCSQSRRATRLRYTPMSRPLPWIPAKPRSRATAGRVQFITGSANAVRLPDNPGGARAVPGNDRGCCHDGSARVDSTKNRIDYLMNQVYEKIGPDKVMSRSRLSSGLAFASLLSAFKVVVR